MKTYDNKLSVSSKNTLKGMINTSLLSVSAASPFSNENPIRSWGLIRLETSNAKFILRLREVQDFPDVTKIEALSEPIAMEQIRTECNSYAPDEWYPVKIGKEIKTIQLFTDEKTDIRGTKEHEILVCDTCGITLIFTDGSSILFEKSDSGSEVWEVSCSKSSVCVFTERKPSNLTCESF